MENHYRHLVAAVLVIVVLVIAGVGWTVLRGGEPRTEVTAAPRQVTIPAGAGASASAVATPGALPGTPAAVTPSRPAPAAAASDVRVHVAGAVRLLHKRTPPRWSGS
jgi:hypothetical protein